MLAGVSVPSVVVGVGAILKLIDLLIVVPPEVKLAEAVLAPAVPGTKLTDATPLPLVNAVPALGIKLAELEGEKVTMVLLIGTLDESVAVALSV